MRRRSESGATTRRRSRRSGAARIAGWLSLAASPCWAIAPATPEQIVCAHDYVVEATVLSADGPCSVADGVRTCIGGDETLRMTLRIDDVLARKDTLRGMAVEAGGALAGTERTGTVNAIPLSAADEAEWTRIQLASIRDSSARATESAATPADRLSESLAAQRVERGRFVASRMKDHLVGDRFVFALNFSRIKPDSFDGAGWGIDQEPRIVDLLRHARGVCAKLRDDGPAHAANGSDPH